MDQSKPPEDSQTTAAFILDDEALVSYLDGELTTEQANIVEAQLSANPAAASRLAQLRQTWDLLDELPGEAPDPKLTQSTMEMLALSIQSEMRLQASNRWSLRKLSWIAAACVAVFLSGFLAMRARQHRANERILDELHVLVDWSSFSNIVSFEWLKSMQDLHEKMENFAQYHPADNGNGDNQSSSPIDFVPTERKDREVWLRGLLESQRRSIADDWRNYTSADPKQRQLARTIADQVYASKSPQQYLKLARIFRSVLDNSIAGRRAKLTQQFSHSSDQQSQIEQRLIELEEAINVKIGSAYGKALPAEDQQAIRAWVDDMDTRYFNTRPPGTQSPVILALKNLDSGFAIQESDIAELFDSLSPPAQEILENLDDEYLFFEHLRNWVVGAVSDHRAIPNDGELISQYLAMQEEEREEVDYMDALNARERLASRANRRPATRSDSNDTAGTKENTPASGSPGNSPN